MTLHPHIKWAAAIALCLATGLGACRRTDGHASSASVAAAAGKAADSVALDGESTSYSIPADPFTYWVSLAEPSRPDKMDEWRRLAGRGEPEAQTYLGARAFANKDFQQAAGWFRKAAEQDNANAQYMVGVQYASGLGALKDYAKAAEWFRKAAERGVKYAQSDLGLLYKLGQGVPKNDQQAAAWFMKAADQGFAPAQFHLALLYRNGQGLGQNVQQAAALTRKAAEQGYAPAQYNLAVFLSRGEGVGKDPKQAFAWELKAAEQGHAMAQHMTGLAYVRGTGTDKDVVLAYQWCSLAVPSLFEASRCVNQALSQMTRAQHEQGKKLVKEWRAQGD